MPERSTAADQLRRVLYLLPLASRDGGVLLTDAASALDVDVATLQRDVADVTARAFYHPAGSADEIQISIEADRIAVFGGRKFTRPPKLSLREALATTLALRAAAAEAGADRRQELLDLAHRIDLELAVSPAEELAGQLEVDEGDAPGSTLRGQLQGAAGESRRCRITYLKPGAAEPEVRDINPYLVVYGRGGWYVLGHCLARDAVRVFRLDRILGVEATDETFDPPDSFDPDAYLDGGRVFRSSEQHTVRVRYSPRIAAWIREKGPCEELSDGSVSVDFSAADPDWVVRHVLQYGPEAEVLEPAELRDVVCEVVGAIAG
jgi:proteasome accessory factor C